ncbi:hypothetical protein AXF42_Ash010618 [Apostasia shenzhenica]|uniref:Uncharacterized protein n=1 Tax=Apostasia shenzhenica TaxID=1088818 RepID=A0A2I0A6L6_9ASPA|nr:hypothetical protein AXF42_Ash010617 [Apostasia shenzhenica]PKA51178.1 hypothetical protein AXF42_Ash010618 [Apostasia shenzhenica]
MREERRREITELTQLSPEALFVPQTSSVLQPVWLSGSPLLSSHYYLYPVYFFASGVILSSVCIFAWPYFHPLSPLAFWFCSLF